MKLVLAVLAAWGAWVMVEVTECRGRCTLEQVDILAPFKFRVFFAIINSGSFSLQDHFKFSSKACSCQSPLSVHRRNVSTMASPVVLVFKGFHHAVYQVNELI